MQNESEGSVSPIQSSKPTDEEAGTPVGTETVESGKNRYVFRGDDNYGGGPVGLSLGVEADGADIQNFAEHVLRKETHRTSRYTSFTTGTKIARKFTSAPDNRYVHKAEVVALRELQTQGVIKIWDSEQVYNTLRQGTKKRARQAADVRAAMRKNREILIEGQIPENILQPAY